MCYQRTPVRHLIHRNIVNTSLRQYLETQLQQQQKHKSSKDLALCLQPHDVVCQRAGERSR